MAKIDFSVNLIDIITDEPVLYTKDTPLTLKIIAINALMSVEEAKEPVDQVEKLSRYDIAMRIKKAMAPLELTAEEISKIKLLACKFYATMIAAQTCLLLEGAENGAKGTKG